MSWAVGEKKNGKERRGRCQASHLPFLYPGYQKSKETPTPLSPPRCTGLRFSCGPSKCPAWKESRNSHGVAEIPEITPQIKTFYQPLIAVQTNYILAKPCQRLPRGIIIKFWAWKCVPILSTSGCFSCRNGAPDHFSFHDVLCIRVAFAGWWGREESGEGTAVFESAQECVACLPSHFRRRGWVLRRIHFFSLPNFKELL